MFSLAKVKVMSVPQKDAKALYHALNQNKRTLSPKWFDNQPNLLFDLAALRLRICPYQYKVFYGKTIDTR